MKLSVKPLAITAVLALGLPTAAPSLAGPATDTLGQCLAHATTTEDEIVLVRWVFSMMAKHPKVADLSSISSDEDDAINRKMGALFTRLLTESCSAETSAAIQADGDDALGNAFGTMSEKAFDKLTDDPAVDAAAERFVLFVDLNKVAQVMIAKSAK